MKNLLGAEIKFASEAVIIFFVLSGYLVGGSVLRLFRTNRWSWKVYLEKRLTRLYMVLLPAIALGVILDRTGLHFAKPGSVYFTPPGIGVITTFHLLERLRLPVIFGNVLFLQGPVVEDVGTNVSIWSLANEFWYYMIFPFAVIALRKSGSALLRIGSGLVACGLLWFVRLSIASLFPVWIFGALLVLLPQRLSAERAKWGTILSTAVLLAAMVIVRMLRMPAIEADYVISLATCLFLFFAVQQKQAASKNAYTAIAGYMSKISYSLYLFHLPMAIFLCSLVNDPWQPWSKTPQHTLTLLSLDAVVLVIVTLLWRIFEANTDQVRLALFGRKAENRSVSA